MIKYFFLQKRIKISKIMLLNFIAQYIYMSSRVQKQYSKIVSELCNIFKSYLSYLSQVYKKHVLRQILTQLQTAHMHINMDSNGI